MLGTKKESLSQTSLKGKIIYMQTYKTKNKGEWNNNDYFQSLV
jgi:hypothetical protein